jgi:hypothetical protein
MSCSSCPPAAREHSGWRARCTRARSIGEMKPIKSSQVSSDGIRDISAWRRQPLPFCPIRAPQVQAIPVAKKASKKRPRAPLTLPSTKIGSRFFGRSRCSQASRYQIPLRKPLKDAPSINRKARGRFHCYLERAKDR